MNIFEITEKLFAGYIIFDEKHPSKLYRYNSKKDIVQEKGISEKKWKGNNSSSRFIIKNKDVKTWKLGEHQEEEEKNNPPNKNKQWLEDSFSEGRLILQNLDGRVYFKNTLFGSIFSIHGNLIENKKISIENLDQIRLHDESEFTGAFASSCDIYFAKKEGSNYG